MFEITRAHVKFPGFIGGFTWARIAFAVFIRVVVGSLVRA